VSVEEVRSIAPVVAVALPIAGAILARPASAISEKVRTALLVGTCALSAVAVFWLFPGVLDGTVYELQLARMTPTIWLYFRVDAMGMLFASTVVVVWILAVAHSAGYMAGEHRQNRYYLFLMLALSWTLGVAFAGNLMTLLVFYELFSILTYPLVVHEETPEAIAAGTKYIIYILLGGGLVMLGILVTYFVGGVHNFGAEALLSIETGRTTLLAVFWCFIAGFGVKAALVPLYGWVPDAHPAAPSPFSAVLSGVMVAAGSFGILRVLFNVFGVELLELLGVAEYVGWIAAATVIVGAFLAVGQDDIKRRLAYSTISQMGYVILGVSLLGPMATAGGLIHIVNHAFMKGTLFLCAGAMIKQTGVRKVSQMAGMGKRLPVTMLALTVSCLAMIGMPPLSGFISKWYLGMGMVEVEQPLYLVVLLGGALLAAMYLLPIVYAAYFKKPDAGYAAADERRGRFEAPMTMLAPVVVGAVVTVLLGALAWQGWSPLALARMAAEAFFG
jgi:multicomponent Na+:H+ antiporter subunit D